SALTLVRERAGRRGITLQINVDDQLGQIRADERKVRQVVRNLLSNAIKFTPERGRIEVGAAPRDGLVEVSVSDTGIGIAPADQEAVFERSSGGWGRRTRRWRARGFRADLVSEVCGTPRRADLGQKPGRRRLHVHVHDTYASGRVSGPTRQLLRSAVVW